MNQSNEVRFSDYAVIGALPEDSNAFMAINTLNESVSILGRETVDAIRQGVRIDDPIFSKDLQELAALNIIVYKEKNEIYSLRCQLTRQTTHPATSYSFTVLTTLGCNLACPYCYAWRYGDTPMSEDTASKVTGWLKNQIEDRALKVTGLHFCGGEPLTNPSVLLAMTSEISGFCRDRGVEFSLLVTTNGVLLTKDIAQDLLDRVGSCQVRVQITLDGPEQMHDARRKTRDGSSSFDAVMRNLRDLATLDSDCRNRLHINTRVNVDRQNLQLDSMMLLAEQLEPLLASGVLAGAYTANVTAACTPHDQYVMPKDEWIAKVPPVWYKIAETYNRDFSMFRNMSKCGEFSEMGLVIAPDGSFYTCQAFAGDRDLAVGHVDTGVDIDAYNEHIWLMPWNECIGRCPVITWCWGWCRAQVLNTTGDWRKRLCQREELIEEGLVYYRFKHRDHIAKWLYNRANGLEDDEESYYKEITVSQA